MAFELSQSLKLNDTSVVGTVADRGDTLAEAHRRLRMDWGEFAQRAEALHAVRMAQLKEARAGPFAVLSPHVRDRCR